MRIAWFRAAPPNPSDRLDETAPILAALGRTHHIDLITVAQAHDFVWRDFRDPYDLYIYELGSTPAHAFMRAYRPHYPGLAAPRGMGVDGSQLPNAPPAPGANPPVPGTEPEIPVPSGFSRNELTVGLLRDSRLDVVRRAVDRARGMGSMVSLLAGGPQEELLARADVIVALEWPPQAGAPTEALLGMAARRAVVVLEVESTAGWPALDPQTWQPRGFIGGTPIVVSIDPRDEEHSLMLAIARLAAEPPLRDALAAAAHAWWRSHATLAHAVEGWEQLLRTSASAPPTAPHGADHTAHLHAILEEFGVGVDFLQS